MDPLLLLELRHKKLTIDDLKKVIDGLVSFDVWEKAIKKTNQGKNKNDLVEDRWLAPVTSYLSLIKNRLNQQGFRTQRGDITIHYLLSFIRSEGDEGLHYLFGDKGFIKVIGYLWGYQSSLKTKLMALVSIKKTRNFENNKCSKKFRTVSERLKQALDTLQGVTKGTSNTPKVRIRTKPKPVRPYS